ncbi:MAG: RluA family pseudouridine synthase [Clostridia bacterium]|nr:RluA family pseudouridine synthase [Clostridia bacterium]
MQILYEDNHLLVAVKPPNLPAQADASGDADMLSLLKGYIKEKYQKPGAVYLGLVHRLDRPAGGVMAFARTSKAASRLCAQFAGHGAQKRYFAVLCGEGTGGNLVDSICREGESGARLCEADAPDAKTARLAYKPIASGANLTLADVSLQTGRHHQIRVQMAGHGLPLWGDQRYNSAAKPGQQLALWAYSLTLDHPTLHRPMTFTALPKGGVWETPGFAPAMEAAAAGFRLVYADANILCVDKPVGLPTAEADGGSDTLEGRLTALYGPVYPLHRLDVHTTGLVLFARTEGARDALLPAFRKRQVHKAYRCVVQGIPAPTDADYTAYLYKDPQKAKVTVYDAPRPDAMEIRTAYRTLASKQGAALLVVDLHTGRTHQIRAHLAHLGHPILGDDKYGDRDWNRAQKVSLPRLAAVSLSFSLPPESPLHYLNSLRFQADPPWTF